MSLKSKKTSNAHTNTWTGNRIFNLFLNTALVVMLAWYGYKYHGLLYPSTRVAEESKAKVIMYSTKWCPFCIEARAMFAKKGIPYFDYDIDKSTDGRDQFINLGGRGVPLFIIKKDVIHGLQKKRINRLLIGK